MDKNPIPVPSHVHYELLLQLLERQTLQAVYQHPRLKGEVNELIISLRKALSQQRQLEENCQRAGLPVEPRWSLNGTPTQPK
ncbi:MAG: DUF5340 family protein [Cyanobacteria bacterium]|nr:DUF5340 family protein [Cyanobacteriota bacterium]MDA0866296.1 DUF5340 family protein [Cyanobacteriota bacterium]